MTRPPRFIIADGSVSHGVACITGRELHHLRDVRRLSVGTIVEMIDPAGAIYTARIVRFEDDAAIAAIDQRIEVITKVTRVILAAAIIKGPRMDFLVEKSAELGADELWPLVTARSVVPELSPRRLERWQRISGAAAKQSLRNRPMMIASPRTVAEMTAIVPSGAVAILCAEGAVPLAQLISEPSRAIVIACGPEGDFDAAEMNQMISAGFICAGLGAHRLRSETAALAALSIVSGALAETTVKD
jgi:16S rRNA (uracil1498-N3)-methyltransferase